MSRSDVSRSDVSRSDVSRSDASRSNGYRSDPLRSDSLRSGSAYGGTIPPTAYSYPQQPYSEPTQSMKASPQGERNGYGNPDGSWAQASPGSDPKRANGGWSPGRPAETGPTAGIGARVRRTRPPAATGPLMILADTTAG